MIYVETITTPANTTKKDPLKTTMVLKPGVIHRLEIQAPPGAEFLHHLIVKQGIYQMWPSGRGRDFALEDTNIEFDEWYELPKNRAEIVVHTWNEDDTYAHIVIVRIGVLSKNVLLRKIF